MALKGIPVSYRSVVGGGGGGAHVKGFSAHASRPRWRPAVADLARRRRATSPSSQSARTGGEEPAVGMTEEQVMKGLQMTRRAQEAQQRGARSPL